MSTPAAWDLARRLVVDEKQSYADAAAATGIPLSTLQKRAAAENWQQQRQQVADYGATCRAIRAALAQEALKAVQAGANPGVYIDALHKADRLAARGSTIDPRARLQAGAELLELVVAFLAEEAPAALKVLEPHLQPIAARWEATCQG